MARLTTNKAISKLTMMNRRSFSLVFWLSLFLITEAISSLSAASPVFGQEQRTKIRLSSAIFSFSGLPLIAARDWKLFSAYDFDAEIIIMRSAVASPALAAGEIDYVAGVGPASVAATLSGLDSRAVWISSDRIAYWLMARPEFKELKDLKSRKIGVSGLGGTTHISFLMALQNQGANPKDFVIVSIPSPQMLQSLESGFVDAAVLNPPTVFFARRRGFKQLLDVGASVEMPAGGLTTLMKKIKTRPDEVKRVTKALQEAKEALLKSKERTVELIVRLLNMDREAATETYSFLGSTLSKNGVPTRSGMENLVHAVKSQGLFRGRSVAFEEIAYPRVAEEVAKELGYKIQ